MKKRIGMFLIAAALFAVPSFAQLSPRQVIGRDPEPTGWSGSTSMSSGQYLDNPCTAVQDFVWVDYSAYVDGKQPDANDNRFLFGETTSMSGTTYTASGSSQSDVQYSPEFSVRKYHKVNTPDDFHVVTVITFNPATLQTTVTLETACGNGMPDSKE